MYRRRISKTIRVGAVSIGGEHPISIESMTNTSTADVTATVTQIRALQNAGCEIVRLAINNTAAAASFAEIRRRVADVPLIADIHFDHNLALAAVAGGADKIRINPGNIGDSRKVGEIAAACKGRGIPIRIGVNGGSLEADLLEKYGVSGHSLAESSLRNVELLHAHDFDNIVVSMKASNIPMTIDAHEILAPLIEYPFHIGITEAGTLYSGTIKSTAGLAGLLTRGIGDTVRISLTADPLEEVKVARELLKALNLRSFGPEIISCPTCGRCEIDLITLAAQVERHVAHIKSPIKIAIMGCVVNGPGEARECHVGIAGGKGVGLLFRHGKIIHKVSERDLLDVLVHEVEDMERDGYEL